MSLRMMRMLLVIVAGVSLIVGSATKQEAPLLPPTFDFTPPSQAGPNSAKVTFALVDANYAQDEPWTAVAPFNTFSESLSSDFQEILAARGFTVRGPFQRYDEMTFPDKKGSDLVLQPDLDVSVTSTAKVVPTLFGKQLEATMVVRGKVKLEVRESLTGERMWFKDIKLTPATVECEGKRYADSTQVPASEGQPAALLQDPKCANLFGPVLEKFYTDVMDAAWRYLEPEEMAMVKKQSQEIKTRKVY